MFCRILTLLVKRLYPTKHPNFSPRLPTKLMCQASFNRIVHWKCQHWSQKTQLNLCIDATRLRWSKFYSFSTFFRFLIVVYIVYNNEKKRYLFHSFLKRHKKFQNFQTLTKFEVPARRASGSCSIFKKKRAGDKETVSTSFLSLSFCITYIIYS